MIMERLIPAPIDEKNVTSDWIEDVFDVCCVGGNHNGTYVGFVNNCVILCEYNGNNIYWTVSEKANSTNSQRYAAFYELKQRLFALDKENENLTVKYSVAYDDREGKKVGMTLHQSFFFKIEV